MLHFPPVHEVFKRMAGELWASVAPEDDWDAELSEEFPYSVDSRAAGGVGAVLMYFRPTRVAVGIHQVHFACVRKEVRGDRLERPAGGVVS